VQAPRAHRPIAGVPIDGDVLRSRAPGRMALTQPSTG
jgi:hypothetical protein